MWSFRSGLSSSFPLSGQTYWQHRPIWNGVWRFLVTFGLQLLFLRNAYDLKNNHIYRGFGPRWSFWSGMSSLFPASGHKYDQHKSIWNDVWRFVVTFGLRLQFFLWNTYNLKENHIYRGFGQRWSFRSVLSPSYPVSGLAYQQHRPIWNNVTIFSHFRSPTSILLWNTYDLKEIHINLGFGPRWSFRSEFSS